MELMSVIAGLEALKRKGEEVMVYSDSRYIVDAVEKGWLRGWIAKQFKGKKNKDLWLRFYKTFKEHKVKFHWIKGHNEHPLNERCDELAVAAALGKNLLPDEGYEQGEKNDLFPG